MPYRVGMDSFEWDQPGQGTEAKHVKLRGLYGEVFEDKATYEAVMQAINAVLHPQVVKRRHRKAKGEEA